MKFHSSTRSYEMNMTDGPIFGKMLLFALPLMASSMLQLFFNAADVIVVGKFAGDHSLAAVGSNTALIALLTNFFLGLSVGVNVLVSRYFGAHDEKNIADTVHTAIAVSIVSGILMAMIGIAGAGTFLHWMGSPDEVMGLAQIYLRIYFIGMPGVMIYNFGAAVLRAIGDTRRALQYLTLSGVLNVLLNLFFVIILRLDVAGVALATMISQWVSAGLVWRCLRREKGAIHLDIHSIHIHRSKLTRILRIGVPAGLQSVLFSFSNVIIQSAINSFGAVTVAGSSASSSLEGFIYVAMNAFYQAVLSFTSANVGAGRQDRIKKILFCGLVSVFVTGFALGNTAVYFDRYLLRFYTGSPEVLEAAAVRFAIVASPYFLCGMMEVMVGTLRGLGYSVMPMLVSLTGACGLRLLWIFTLFRTPRFHTVETLYYTYPVTWSITLAAHVICFLYVTHNSRKNG